MNSLPTQPITETSAAARQRRSIIAASDFKAVIATLEGRRFVRRVLAECGVHQTSFTGEPLSMAYREGRRSIGLWLQALFMDCPDHYMQILTEEANDRNSD